MNDSQYFIAKDYHRASNLKNQFQKYVDLFTQLNYPNGEKPLSITDRQELSLKLEDATNDMQLHVLKLKEAKFYIEILKNSKDFIPVPHQQANESHLAN